MFAAIGGFRYLQTGSNGVNWFMTYTGTSYEDVVYDLTNNVFYTIGNQTAKFDSDGIIGWQKTLSATGQVYQPTSAAYDKTTGDVYIVATLIASGNSESLLVKYDSSGTLQWQKKLASPGVDNGYGVAVDSAGNVYISGVERAGGISIANLLLAKYNSSGTLQWQVNLDSGGTDVSYGMTIDSSDNIYVTGYVNDTVSNDLLLVKYDTSGTLIWQRRLENSGTSDDGRAVAVDSSGNIYVVGNTGNANDVLLAKYNSSGTLIWQRTLSSAGDDHGYGVAIDSDDNVYIVGDTNTSGNYQILVAKYDSSGTIQWQRTLGSTGTDNGYGISVDNMGNYYIVGKYVGSPSTVSLTAKLPTDGSLTGSYAVGGRTLSYQPSSLTDSAGTLTNTTSILTAGVPTLTSSNATLTSSTAAFTSTKVSI